MAFTNKTDASWADLSDNACRAGQVRSVASLIMFVISSFVPGWPSCWGPCPSTAAPWRVWWASALQRTPPSVSPAAWLLLLSAGRVSYPRAPARRCRCRKRPYRTIVPSPSPSRRPAGPVTLGTDWGRWMSSLKSGENQNSVIRMTAFWKQLSCVNNTFEN